MDTFAIHQNKATSEKIGLVLMQSAYRLTGWELHSGSVYSAPVAEKCVVSLSQDGVALTATSSLESVSEGNYYFDRHQEKIFLWTNGSVNPDTVFISTTVKLFFSNVGVTAPHDLSTGYEVNFMALIAGDVNFDTNISTTKNLLGVALTSASKIDFVNDAEFWSPIFDKYTFETQPIEVYSWSRNLEISQASIIYKGKIQKKDWSEDRVSFSLVDVFDELRSPVPTENLSSHPTAIVPRSFSTAKQRVLYGKVLGHVLTPIDQALTEGNTLNGTISVNNGSTTVTGSGTAFLNDLSPGDQLFLGDFQQKVSVESIASDTSLTLSEDFSGISITSEPYKVIPSHNKRYLNRKYLVSGHELARPSTTVSAVLDAATIYFADSSFPAREGDFVEINGQQAEIRVLGQGFFQFVQALESTPSNGDSIYLPPVANLHIDTESLNLTRDYTYDANSAIVTLDDLAEFNITPIRSVTGDITIADGNRTITGSSTIFTEEFSPGDWIKGASNDDWFEVLEVTDDTNLIVRTTPTASDTVSAGSGERKNPNVIGNETVVSADCFGKPDSNGNVLQTAGSITKDLLISSGLESEINSTSFDEFDDLAPYRLGFAIPSEVRSKRTTSIRDAVNNCCRSAFASVVLNESYKLEIVQISPEYQNLKTLNEGDIFNISVNVDSNDISTKAIVSFASREYDSGAAASSNIVESVSSNAYLVDTSKESQIETVLVDASDAEVMASRWLFLLERATNYVRVDTSIQAIRWKIGDVVRINYPKLFQRFGSTDSVRLGLIMGLRKSLFGVSLTVNDLGNSFSRACRISPDDSEEYSNASDLEKATNGFLTDADGFTESVNDINVIW